MSKRDESTLTLKQIVNGIAATTDGHWADVMGIEIDGRKEAIEAGNHDRADQLADSYLWSNAKRLYRVVWPEHVTIPKFNSDASYLPQ